MEIQWLLKNIALTIIIILMSTSLGIYSGIKNSEDTIYRTLYSEQLIDEVRVYRDKLGFPTIIAKNMQDLIFAQAYEFARDRTWQIELYRSIINGELARLFGSELIETDQFLRTIGFKRSAEAAVAKLDPQILLFTQAYINGLNSFSKTHQSNLPLELQVLNKKPKLWTISDVLGMQGVMAYNFAFSGLSTELLRLDIIKKVGSQKALEIFPIGFPPARDYFLNYNDSINLQSTQPINPLSRFINKNNLQFNLASNNWVLHGNKTKSGNPLIANDPHLGLEAPGLWYQVHLILEDNSFNVQGYTIPGVPLILMGHNKNVAWGATSALIDALDLFYLIENDTHYIINNEWKKFDFIQEAIEVGGKSDVQYTIRLTDYGPMMNTTNGFFAIKWTLLENYSRDQIFKAVYQLNIAKNIQDIHDALYYWVTPGINFVFASVNGDIGYQYAGLLPIRMRGYGLLPENGSNGKNGWNGTINYGDQLFVINPKKGYFATANDRVDKRELFYINEGYAHDYRVNRIKEILVNKTDFITAGNKFSTEDMQLMQADTKNLAAVDIIESIRNDLSSYAFSSNNVEIQAVKILLNWNYRMIKESIAATIFATFRLFLIQQVFEDELGTEITDRIMYAAVKSVSKFLRENKTNHWFDDILTSNQNETAVDITRRAFEKTIEYLIMTLGKDINSWNWGRVHKVSYKHIMGDFIPLIKLQAGPKASSGSTFTINSYLPSPSWNEGKITYDSSYGPSYRFIAEVESTWLNVISISPPGVSGHPLSEHYNDIYENWLDFKYNNWSFDQNIVISSNDLSFIYKKEE